MRSVGAADKLPNTSVVFKVKETGEYFVYDPLIEEKLGTQGTPASWISGFRFALRGGLFAKPQMGLQKMKPIP